jgi:hypothetical protein
MHYPNFTDEEENVVRQFVEKYEEENGWSETLRHYPNYIPNIVYNIYRMINADPDHPHHKEKQFIRAVSKMDPESAITLKNMLEKYEKHILRDHEIRNNTEDRKPKKPVRKVTRCKCKK